MFVYDSLYPLFVFRENERKKKKPINLKVFPSPVLRVPKLFNQYKGIYIHFVHLVERSKDFIYIILHFLAI